MRQAFGLVFVLLLSGCTLIAQSPPRVEVTNVSLTGFGLLDESVAVTLCLTNPNLSGMDFSRVAFRISMTGAPFADGVSEAPIVLPPLASVLVPLSVATTVRNVGMQLMTTLTTGVVAYRLSGSVQPSSLPFSIPFSREGRFSVMQAGEQIAESGAPPGGTRCQTSPPLLESVQ